MKQRTTTTTRTGASKPSFISDTIAELKKVTWLSRPEVAYLTGLVLVVTVTVGIVLALVDFGFTELVNRVFLGI
jgi:preprotein translocase SecE subunit